MVKRLFDFVICIMMLPLVCPLLLVIAMIIKNNSPGPVFYRGVRIGLNGKPFKIYKFRTMVQNAESIGGPSTALNDPRLTRSGKFLRKYKIDELPQLINIICGEMSIVGPRPQVEKYTALYTEKENEILSVRPGLTDYSSVHFINLDEILGDDAVDEKYLKEIEPEKNRLRLKYVRDQSTWTDVRIIFMTIAKMLGMKSDWNISR